MIKILSILIIFAIFISPDNAHEMTVCNCDHPIAKGIIDLSNPKYCDQHSPVTNVRTTHYVVLVTEERHSWTGYACNQWLHQKEISKFFFGSHDTIFSKTIRKVSPDECWRTVRYPFQCGTNPIFSDGNTFKFIQEPNGDGVWLTTQYYTSLNCFSQKITLTKDCENCPIKTPIGTLNNSTNNTYGFHNDLTIVWEKDKK